MQKLVRVEHEANGLVRMTLDRPEQNNVLNGEMLDEIRDTLRAMSKEKGIRAMILTGAGENFCDGADLPWVQENQQSTPSAGRDPGTTISEVMSELDRFPTPVIARVNGHAQGAGVGLIACCDIAVSAADAEFTVPEVHVGLSAAAAAPFIICSIGSRQTRRLLLSGETINAEKAENIGLVHRVAEPGALDKAMQDYIDLLLKGAPSAQVETKLWIEQLVITGHHDTAAFHRAAGIAFRRCLSNKDAKNGIEAHLKDVKPEWVPE